MGLVDHRGVWLRHLTYRLFRTLAPSLLSRLSHLLDD